MIRQGQGKPLIFPISSSYLEGKNKSEKKKLKRDSISSNNNDPQIKRKYKRKRFGAEKRNRPRIKSNDFLNESFSHSDNCVWRPADDLRLIINLKQVEDLHLVFLGVKFSYSYTLDQIESRWRTLLFDYIFGKVAQKAIKNLHPKIISNIYNTALFSPREEGILKDIKSNLTLDERYFQDVLYKNIDVFLRGRTSRSLYKHWILLKEFHLLKDQDVENYTKYKSFVNFEDSIDDIDLMMDSVDEAVNQEILKANRKNKGKIRLLEEEVANWREVTGLIVPEDYFNDNVYAILQGKEIKFMMNRRELTIGRNTVNNTVDVDLSFEESSSSISRRQATIRLQYFGDFIIMNEGSRPFLINGNVIRPDQICKLRDQSIIDIGNLTFTFLINENPVLELQKYVMRDEIKKELLGQDLNKRYMHKSSVMPKHSNSAFVNTLLPYANVKNSRPGPGRPRGNANRANSNNKLNKSNINSTSILNINNSQQNIGGSASSSLNLTGSNTNALIPKVLLTPLNMNNREFTIRAGVQKQSWTNNVK